MSACRAGKDGKGGQSIPAHADEQAPCLHPPLTCSVLKARETRSVDTIPPDTCSMAAYIATQKPPQEKGCKPGVD